MKKVPGFEYTYIDDDASPDSFVTAQATESESREVRLNNIECLIQGERLLNKMNPPASTRLKHLSKEVNKLRGDARSESLSAFGDTAYATYKQAKDDLELSTQYGRLLRDNPAELNRLMKEDPKAYDRLCNEFTAAMLKGEKELNRLL